MTAALLALALSTLPATGAISFSAIQTEFARGGVNPISLSEYLRGGFYVYTTDTGVSGIPTTYSNISVNAFHGAARSAALTAALNDYAPAGACNNPTPPYTCGASTQSITCSGTGGTPGYTYAWAYVSGHTGFTISPNSTSAAVYWTHSAANQIVTAVWRCTVTDSASATATVNVTVSMDHSGL
jgi:hypothetical protein